MENEPQKENSARMSIANEPKQKNKAVPVAIVIAGIIIAGAIIFSADKNTVPIVAGNVAAKQQLPQGDTASLDKMALITASDHVRGNPDALVKIVGYSDTECPFCKRFHETMKQIMDEYGKSGKVAWVYRHFPLDQLHPVKARNEATAFECAVEQGGNDKFWEYADRLFEITPSNNNLDPAELPKIAQYVGLDVSKFKTCLTSQKYAKHVEDDLQNAEATGGNGTPWSIIVAPNGNKFPLNGAQSYETVKQLIELALQEK